MRPHPLLAAGLGALAISVPGLGCGSANEVAAVDFAFEPQTAEISAGDTLTWTNDGETIHNVKGKGFFSEAIDPGGSYEHTFEEEGTYEYLCNLHPDQMRGTVEVSG